MECITTTTLSMLVSGKPRKAFHPERGTRQGDPISLYFKCRTRRHVYSFHVYLVWNRDKTPWAVPLILLDV